MMGDMAAAVKNPCVGCGEPAATSNDAIGHFGGSICAQFCELCDEINDLLWELATIRLQIRVTAVNEVGQNSLSYQEVSS